MTQLSGEEDKHRHIDLDCASRFSPLHVSIPISAGIMRRCQAQKEGRSEGGKAKLLIRGEGSLPQS